MDRRVGDAQGHADGREGELPVGALESNATGTRTRLRPDRRRFSREPDDELLGTDRKDNHGSACQREQPSPLVSSRDLVGDRVYFDTVECAAELGQRYSEKQAHNCKDQHQLQETKTLSHRGILDRSYSGTASFLGGKRRQFAGLGRG